MDSLPPSLPNCSDTNPNSTPSRNPILLGPTNGFAPSGDNLRINLRIQFHHHLGSDDNRNPLSAADTDCNLHHNQASELATQSLQDIKGDSSILEKDPAICCPICKEEVFIDLEVKVLPCKHTYHVNCISRWLKIKNSCPVCRFQLPIKVDEEFDRQGLVISEEFLVDEDEDDDFQGAWHPSIRRVPRSYNLSAMFPGRF